MTDIDMATPEGRREWAKRCQEAELKRLENYKPVDRVDAVCHEASKQAGQFAKADGLHPHLSEGGEYEYEVQQGLRSAHWAREDSAATLILMRPVLYGLRAAHILLWIAIALLAAILWRIW